MRITLPVLTLLSATSVFSFAFNKRATELSDACQEEVVAKPEYMDCIEELSIINYSRLCKAYETPECKQYFEDPASVFPSCVNDEAFKSIALDPLMQEYSVHLRKYVCTFDETGNLCPLARNTLTIGTFYGATITNSCSSQNCSEGAYDMFKYVKDNFSKLEEADLITGDKNTFNEAVKFLDSKDCTKQHSGSQATYKIGTSLLFTLMGILLLL